MKQLHGLIQHCNDIQIKVDCILNLRRGRHHSVYSFHSNFFHKYIEEIEFEQI
jgi:hypothetical protein